MTINKIKVLALTIALYIFSFLTVVNADDNSKKSTLKQVIPDTAITTAIKSKYLVDPDIKSLSIHVETINGTVTLTGKVPNNQVKSKVESIARDTNGVKSIVSKVDITE